MAVRYGDVLVCFCEDPVGAIGCLDMVENECYLSDKRCDDLSLDPKKFIPTGARYCYYFDECQYAQDYRID